MIVEHNAGAKVENQFRAQFAQDSGRVEDGPYRHVERKLDQSHRPRLSLAETAYFRDLCARLPGESQHRSSQAILCPLGWCEYQGHSR